MQHDQSAPRQCGTASEETTARAAISGREVAGVPDQLSACRLPHSGSSAARMRTRAAQGVNERAMLSGGRPTDVAAPCHLQVAPLAVVSVGFVLDLTEEHAVRTRRACRPPMPARITANQRGGMPIGPPVAVRHGPGSPRSIQAPRTRSATPHSGLPRNRDLRSRRSGRRTCSRRLLSASSRWLLRRRSTTPSPALVQDGGFDSGARPCRLTRRRASRGPNKCDNHLQSSG